MTSNFLSNTLFTFPLSTLPFISLTSLITLSSFSISLSYLSEAAASPPNSCLCSWLRFLASISLSTARDPDRDITGIWVVDICASCDCRRIDGTSLGANISASSCRISCWYVGTLSVSIFLRTRGSTCLRSSCAPAAVVTAAGIRNGIERRDLRRDRRRLRDRRLDARRLRDRRLDRRRLRLRDRRRRRCLILLFDNKIFALAKQSIMFQRRRSRSRRSRGRRRALIAGALAGAGGLGLSLGTHLSQYQSGDYAKSRKKAKEKEDDAKARVREFAKHLLDLEDPSLRELKEQLRAVEKELEESKQTIHGQVEQINSLSKDLNGVRLNNKKLKQLRVGLRLMLLAQKKETQELGTKIRNATLKAKVCANRFEKAKRVYQAKLAEARANAIKKQDDKKIEQEGETKTVCIDT